MLAIASRWDFVAATRSLEDGLSSSLHALPNVLSETDNGRPVAGLKHRHLRADDGGAGHLALSAECSEAADCAPGLFTVSIISASTFGDNCYQTIYTTRTVVRFVCIMRVSVFVRICFACTCIARVEWIWKQPTRWG